MLIRNLGVGLIGILAIHSVAFANYSIFSSKSDFEPRVGLNSTGPNGVYTTTASTTAATVRVGVSGSVTNRVYGNAAFMFQLPVLAPGETITAASLQVVEMGETTPGNPAANADLWAIGFDNNNPPLNSAAESQSYFFNGSVDTGPGIGTGASRMLIQDNLLVPTDVITTPSTIGLHQTDATGGANLLAYIQSLYANPNVIPGTSNLIVRLNYDSDTYAPTSDTGANRYLLAASDNTNAGASVLRLTTQQVPEPAALSIFGSAMLALSARRRRNNV